jgi:putative ABC transport system permease protein
MLKNYIKIIFRTAKRNKGYTTINMLGLTLGITCALAIFLYVYDEFTYDHNHINANKIYRINGGWKSMTDGSSNTYPQIGYIVGEYFKKDFPEIDQMVRITASSMNIEKPGTSEQIAEQVFKVDPNIFNVFTFPLIEGANSNLLPDNNSMVITRKTAIKYFGRESVVGETLHWIGQDTVDLKITGVMKDYPDNTHLKFDVLVRLRENENQRPDWFEFRFQTFFTLKPNVNIQSIESRVKLFTKSYVSDYEKEIGFMQEFSITPFSKIHLHSKLTGENNSEASYVYIFLIIGVFILLMACINFVNLATARSMKRAKEIGVRKVSGALKNQLVGQFLGEAFLITLLATTISVVAVYFILPTVNIYSGKNLVILNNPVYWAMVLVILTMVTIMSGSYPSFILSAFKPSETLKGTFRTSKKGNYLRQGLVIFQFVISVSLIASTLIIMNHLNFLRSKELGFNKDQVLLIKHATDATKEQLLNISSIKQTSFSNKVPGMGGSGRTIFNGWNKNDPQVVMDQVVVDYDYIDLYNLKILEGRGFSRDIPSDRSEAFIINETALSKLGYKTAKEAIGRELWLDEDWDGKKGRIIGVLKDFHYNGVNSIIQPFAMFMHPTAKRMLSVKLSSSNFPDILKQVEEVYKATVPNQTFEFSFLDQDFDRQYQGEDRFMNIFSFFASIGIAIGCLGLYGLAMFMAEQRTKEVGIRKVLGATGGSILTLLSSNFLKLVAVSFIIAIPIAYYSMEKWLSKFPYREKIDPILFVITAGAVLAITILTVSYQAIRAAMTNPVKSLRTE